MLELKSKEITKFNPLFFIIKNRKNQLLKREPQKMGKMRLEHKQDSHKNVFILFTGYYKT